MPEEQKRKTRTSAAVKNRYNAKAYDRITLFVPKGDKDRIKERASGHGESLNGYITRLIAEDMNGENPLD